MIIYIDYNSVCKIYIEGWLEKGLNIHLDVDHHSVNIENHWSSKSI